MVASTFCRMKRCGAYSTTLHRAFRYSGMSHLQECRGGVRQGSVQQSLIFSPLTLCKSLLLLRVPNPRILRGIMLAKCSYCVFQLRILRDEIEDNLARGPLRVPHRVRQDNVKLAAALAKACSTYLSYQFVKHPKCRVGAHLSFHVRQAARGAPPPAPAEHGFGETPPES